MQRLVQSSQCFRRSEPSVLRRALIRCRRATRGFALCLAAAGSGSGDLGIPPPALARFAVYAARYRNRFVANLAVFLWPRGALADLFPPGGGRRFSSD